MSKFCKEALLSVKSLPVLFDIEYATARAFFFGYPLVLLSNTRVSVV